MSRSTAVRRGCPFGHEQVSDAPIRCRVCGTSIGKVEGYYGVFVWTPDGRYPLANAIRKYRSEKLAYRYVDKAGRRDLVVRWAPLPIV